MLNVPHTPLPQPITTQSHINYGSLWQVGHPLLSPGIELLHRSRTSAAPSSKWLPHLWQLSRHCVSLGTAYFSQHQQWRKALIRLPACAPTKPSI